jgi:hypothetical protein
MSLLSHVLFHWKRSNSDLHGERTAVRSAIRSHEARVHDTLCRFTSVPHVLFVSPDDHKQMM